MVRPSGWSTGLSPVKARDSGKDGDLLISQHPGQGSCESSLLITPAPAHWRVCLFLQSLPALCGRREVSDLPWGAPEVVNQHV